MHPKITLNLSLFCCLLVLIGCTTKTSFKEDKVKEEYSDLFEKPPIKLSISENLRSLEEEIQYIRSHKFVVGNLIDKIFTHDPESNNKISLVSSSLEHHMDDTLVYSTNFIVTYEIVVKLKSPEKKAIVRATGEAENISDFTSAGREAIFKALESIYEEIKVSKINS